MRITRQWAAATLGAVLTLALVPGAAPANAASPAASATAATHTLSLYAPSAVALTISQGENPEPVMRASTLVCTPNGGTHPAIAEACSALTSVGGDFTSLVPAKTFCTREHEPYTVTARGVWRGQMLDVRATYGNRCMLAAATGPLFTF